MGFEVEGIVMIASDDPGGGQDIALPIGDGQNVGGLGFLASLIGHRLAAFLGNRMTAIEVQLLQVKVNCNDFQAMLPNDLKTSISAPLAKVIVDRLPTDLPFFGSSGSVSIGTRAH